MKIPLNDTYYRAGYAGERVDDEIAISLLDGNALGHIIGHEDINHGVAEIDESPDGEDEDSRNPPFWGEERDEGACIESTSEARDD